MISAQTAKFAIKLHTDRKVKEVLVYKSTDNPTSYAFRATMDDSEVLDFWVSDANRDMTPSEIEFLLEPVKFEEWPPGK